MNSRKCACCVKCSKSAKQRLPGLNPFRRVTRFSSRGENEVFGVKAEEK